MIASLTGRLASKHPGGVVIDVQGVGYDVLIPLSTYYRLPDPEQPVSLTIHTHVREDAIQLFGFSTQREKDAFLMLLGVSGIGPKLALSVISSLSVDDLAAAIRTDDQKTLASVPGIGKKSAARLALELTDKVEKLGAAAGRRAAKADEPSGKLMDDALSALVNLGYKAADVKDVIKQVLAGRNGDTPLQDLIRAALQELAK
ncbi:MAG: Holliday junction branch migration protein RuvA [Nitrospiraceae bacterium]|nr:MAG: Holliday junction branch migration protein RuvA [Nitrospiraceae bacterium]